MDNTWPLSGMIGLQENPLVVELEGKRYVGECRSGGVASVDPDGPPARIQNARWYFTIDGESVADFEADRDDTVESVTAQLKGALDAAR